MRWKLACLAIALAGSPALAQAPQPKGPPAIPAPVLAALKAAAGLKLKDPGSAQYERMNHAMRPNVRGEPTEVVCGYINAKNSFGGYAGATPFVYFVGRRAIEFRNPGDPVDSIIVPAMLKTFCTGLI